ncbi:MAG: hypothetical protein KTR31_37895 [Myxococcales bacterium]|nr:hypothetical protein [Myxococcales bacterium]
MTTRTGRYLFACHQGYAHVFDWVGRDWIASVPTAGFGSTATLVELDDRLVVVELGLEGFRATDAQSLEVLWWVPPSATRGNSMGFAHATALDLGGTLRVGAHEILKYGNERVLIDPRTGKRQFTHGGQGRFFGSADCREIHGLADATSVTLRATSGATLVRLSQAAEPVDVQEHVGFDGTRFTVTSQVFDFGPDKVQMAFGSDRVLIVTGVRLASHGVDGRLLWEGTVPSGTRFVQGAHGPDGWLGTLQTDAGLALYRLGPTPELLREGLDTPGQLVRGGFFVRDGHLVSDAITGEPKASLGPVPTERLPRTVGVPESSTDLHPFGRHEEERRWSEGEGIRELFLFERRTLFWCWRATPEGPRYFRFRHVRQTADGVARAPSCTLSGPWPLRALVSEAEARLSALE